MKAIMREPFVKRTSLEDESIYSFFSRRFNKDIANNLVSAMVHGIYAGNIHQLSIKVWLIVDHYHSTNHHICLQLSSLPLNQSGMQNNDMDLLSNLSFNQRRQISIWVWFQVVHIRKTLFAAWWSTRFTHFKMDYQHWQTPYITFYLIRQLLKSDFHPS